MTTSNRPLARETVPQPRESISLETRYAPVGIPAVAAAARYARADRAGERRADRQPSTDQVLLFG